MKESYSRLVEYENALKCAQAYMVEFGRKLFKVDEENGQIKREKPEEGEKELKGMNFVNLSNIIGIIHQYDKD